MMNLLINELLDYGLQNKLIQEDDVDYSANRLIDLLGEDSFTRVIRDQGREINFDDLLTLLLDQACDKELIDKTTTQRDLFDNKIMNCIMPRPSEVVNTFCNLYKDSPVSATDYFYKLSIASNYIRKSRTDKNISYTHNTKYGEMKISINLSKPEKDPRDIAKAKLMVSHNYPTCVLCKENVGFSGNLNRDARVTHRLIPIELNHKRFYFQYSPYVYYNEHCIILDEEHKPMEINYETFQQLFDFINVFPHYMIGSNADLPIVGGSILSHNHYQGGCDHFPVEDAKVIKEWITDNNIKIQLLNWPLSTIRVSGKNENDLRELAMVILNTWKDYSCENCEILSHTDGQRHNTITPILRMNQKNYELDLVLRNNRTNSDYPDGIFHPHQESHHIKKENIGLIEVMGLAILPARLKDELSLIEKCWQNNEDIKRYPELEKHSVWYKYLREQFDDKQDIRNLLKAELTKKYVSVLEDAGVFKMDQQGINEFTRFIDKIRKIYALMCKTIERNEAE